MNFFIDFHIYIEYYTLETLNILIWIYYDTKHNSHVQWWIDKYSITVLNTILHIFEYGKIVKNGGVGFALRVSMR